MTVARRAAMSQVGAGVPMPFRRLMAFEVLHRAFVLLGLGARLEGAEIAALAGLRVDLARIEALAAGLELADHRRPPLSGCRLDKALRVDTSPATSGCRVG